MIQVHKKNGNWYIVWGTREIGKNQIHGSLGPSAQPGRNEPTGWMQADHTFGGIFNAKKFKDEAEAKAYIEEHRSQIKTPA